MSMYRCLPICTDARANSAWCAPRSVDITRVRQPTVAQTLGETRFTPKRSPESTPLAPNPSSSPRWPTSMTPAEFHDAALARTRGVLVDLDDPFRLLLVALLVGG